MVDSTQPDLTHSEALYQRALQVVPLATQTHSKARRPALDHVEPAFLQRGNGCRVWDVDGNEYIDFRGALGPILLGYRYAAVDDAVRKQLDNGMVFSYPHPLEVQVAEELVQLIPCAQSVRFLKTGGEAMAAAHRLARAFTERDLLLTCGYHGWVNSMSRAGVPQAMRALYRELPWGDLAAYETVFGEHRGNVAAVSVACSYAEVAGGDEFLRSLRELTEHYGALLVFDEVVTGFRLHVAGAQGYFGVTPDLAVFAKGISNGVPLSCYTGRADVMRQVEEVVISSTYGGDTLGLAAAAAVLDVCRREDVVGHIWTRGKQLHKGFNEICLRLGLQVHFAGLPPLGMLVFDAIDKARDLRLFLRFNSELLKRGLIIYSVFYISYSHSEADIEQTLEHMEAALTIMCRDGAFAS